MSSELEVYGGADSWANMLEPVARLSQLIAPTEFVNRAYRGKPASVAAAILAGRELGLGPTTALRVLHVIEGQVSMSADAMAGRVLAAGHRIEWLQSTDKIAELRITRGDGLGEAHVAYTMRDAERSGDAQKRNYQKYPRAMLRARAITECVRMIAADILLGLDATEHEDTLPPLVDEQPAGTVRLSVAKSRPPMSDAASVAFPNDPQDESDVTEHIVETQTVSPQQLRKLNAQLSELEARDGKKLTRDERRGIILALAGADELESARDLTYEQASRAIDALTQTLDATEPEQNDDESDDDMPA